MLLKNGSETTDPRLDRVYELDWRSLSFPVTEKRSFSKEEKKPRSLTWGIYTTLDQGIDGACVGFAYAHDLLCRPYVVKKINQDLVDYGFAKRKIYWEAQKIDEWSGGAYPGANPFGEGTSILAGAKVLQRMGAYLSYSWGLTINQMVFGVAYDGPCVFGINWYDGMFRTDSQGFVRPTGVIVGGHAILIYGVRIKYKKLLQRLIHRTWDNIDLDKSYFNVKNSWGPGWGQNGSCKISLRDADRLLNEQGDACFPTRKFVL